MNKSFTRKPWLAGRFAKFLLDSGNRYRVHSPFLYSLVNEVIRNNDPFEGRGKIEEIREELVRSKEIIRKTDFGTGGVEGEATSYLVPVGRIASQSLSSARHALRLYRLARYMKAQNILEIGTSLGITTSYLAMASSGAKVFTLEGCPELCRLARNNFDRLGLRNISLLEGRFEKTLPEALDQLGKADLVFIDGNHRPEAMLSYYRQCLNYTGNDSIIIFDDIRSSPGTEKAWEEIRRGPGVSVSLDLFFTGWVFFRKESSKEHFRLRYF